MIFKLRWRVPMVVSLEDFSKTRFQNLLKKISFGKFLCKFQKDFGTKIYNFIRYCVKLMFLLKWGWGKKSLGYEIIELLFNFGFFFLLQILILLAIPLNLFIKISNLTEIFQRQFGNLASKVYNNSQKNVFDFLFSKIWVLLSVW